MTQDKTRVYAHPASLRSKINCTTFHIVTKLSYFYTIIRYITISNETQEAHRSNSSGTHTSDNIGYSNYVYDDKNNLNTMTMKNFFYIMISLMIASLLLSCSSDDSSQKFTTPVYRYVITQTQGGTNDEGATVFVTVDQNGNHSYFDAIPEYDNYYMEEEVEIDVKLVPSGYTVSMNPSSIPLGNTPVDTRFYLSTDETLSSDDIMVSSSSYRTTDNEQFIGYTLTMP